MFGRSNKTSSSGYAPPEHSVGAQLLNMIGENLLGVNVLGQRDRRAAMQQLQQGNQEAAGLFQPVPGQPMQVPVANQDGADISDAFAPQMARGPSRQRTPQELAAGLASLAAKTPGFDPTKWRELATYAKPDVQYDRGFGYDKGTGAPMGGFHPDMDKGQGPLYDMNGRIAGIQNLPGAVGAAADMAGGVAGAQEAAKAPYDLRTVAGPNGPITATLPHFLGNPVLGQSPGDIEYGKGRAGAASDTMKGLQTAGQLAPTKIARYHQIDGLLAGFEGGKLAPTGVEMASALNSLGFKMSPKLQNAQAADALSKQLVLDLNGGSLGTGFSNADRDFLQSTVPSILQSAGSRRQLINIGIAAEQRKQDVANKARQWEQRFGRIDKPDATGKTFQDYVDVWSAKNPVFPRQ